MKEKNPEDDNCFSKKKKKKKKNPPPRANTVLGSERVLKK